jgi:LPS-assembly lipoprotein
MSLFKKIAIVFLLCSCGFKPVYQQTNYVDGSETASDALASVDVIAQHDLNGQFFQTTLTDLLNPTAKAAPKKYRLDVKLDKSETALSIEQDRTITRYKVTVTAKYKLTDTDTSKIISEGALRRDSDYDKVTSDYATYVSAEDSARRATKELASDMKLKVIAALMGK